MELEEGIEGNSTLSGHRRNALGVLDQIFTHGQEGWYPELPQDTDATHVIVTKPDIPKYPSAVITNTPPSNPSLMVYQHPVEPPIFFKAPSANSAGQRFSPIPLSVR